VFAGQDRPLARPLVTAEHVHGRTGLDGTDMPPPQTPVQDMPAVDFLITSIREHPAGAVTIATLGPLTNLGLALQQAPDIAPRIGQVVMMGGGFFEGGNITVAAEFNIYVDPEAADIIFRSGIPIVMMPLDVTHKVLTHQRRIYRFAGLGNETGRQVANMLSFSERFDEEKYGTDGGPLHDPCTIAWLLAPELFSGRHCNVVIETRSELTLGMTVIDWWRVSDRAPNAHVMRDVDDDGFFALLASRLATLP
jgi:purine nucleosidase